MNQKITTKRCSVLISHSSPRPKFRFISEVLNVSLKQQGLLSFSHCTGSGKGSVLSPLCSSDFVLSSHHFPCSRQSGEVWTGRVDDKLGRNPAGSSGSKTQSSTSDWFAGRHHSLLMTWMMGQSLFFVSVWFGTISNWEKQ